MAITANKVPGGAQPSPVERLPVWRGNTMMQTCWLLAHAQPPRGEIPKIVRAWFSSAFQEGYADRVRKIEGPF